PDAGADLQDRAWQRGADAFHRHPAVRGLTTAPFGAPAAPPPSVLPVVRSLRGNEPPAEPRFGRGRVTTVDDPKSIGLTRELHEYLVAHGTPPDEVQRSLIERTAALGGVARMQTAPEQGAFMTMLARLLQV